MIKINCISIGGSAIPYGNVYDDSTKYGNYKLEYACQSLRDNGYAVGMIYFQNSDDNEFIVNKVKESDIIIVLMDLLNKKKCLELFAKLKEIKEITIIIFGRYVDYEYKELLVKNSCLDYCCLGDPYKSLNKLVEGISNNKKIVSEHIATSNDLNKRLEINSNQEIWPCFDYYENDSFKNNRKKTHVLTTKNEFCIGNCSFCWAKKEKIIYKSIDRIVSEIDFVSSKFGVRNFLFVDNDFFDILSKKRVADLIELFNRIKQLNKNLNFTCFARCKSITVENENLYYKMKEIGFSCVFLGVDTGNENDRILYNKLSTIEEGKKAIKILKKVGLYPRIGFIAVNPYTSVNTLKENFLFLKQVKSANYYHYGGLKLMLFPGTPIFKKVSLDSLIYNPDSIYGYKFVDEESRILVEAASFFFDKIREEGIVDYLKLRRMYEYGVSINKEVYHHYSKFIDNYEKEEFRDIILLFECLYIEKNVEKFNSQIEFYVKRFKERASNNKKLIGEIKTIIYNTPIDKEIMYER